MMAPSIVTSTSARDEARVLRHCVPIVRRKRPEVPPVPRAEWAPLVKALLTVIDSSNRVSRRIFASQGAPGSRGGELMLLAASSWVCGSGRQVSHLYATDEGKRGCKARLACQL